MTMEVAPGVSESPSFSRPALLARSRCHGTAVTVAPTPAVAWAAPEARWISVADTPLRETVVAATLSHSQHEDFDDPRLLAPPP